MCESESSIDSEVCYPLILEIRKFLSADADGNEISDLVAVIVRLDDNNNYNSNNNNECMHECFMVCDSSFCCLFFSSNKYKINLFYSNRSLSRFLIFLLPYIYISFFLSLFLALYR